MGTGVNGDLGQMDIWGKGSILKGYSKCPLGLFPRNFHKWALGENEHVDKGYPKCRNIPVPISPQMFANEQWGKWALGKMYIWRKEVPQVP